MPQVYNWRARRSGKGMTIEGIDDRGRAIKLTEIDCIDADSGVIVGRRSAQPCCILSTKRLTLRLDDAKD